MDEKQIANIKKYLKIINPDVKDDELLDFVINEVLDRVQLYLNSETIPSKIERIIANIVNTGLTKALNIKNNSGEVEQVITSISDNGQSISYTNDVKKYFVAADDEELFSGFTSLLGRYRRVKVVYPKSNE